MNTKIEIKYKNGAAITCGSVREAMHQLRSEIGDDLYIVDAGGFERYLSDPGSEYDVRNGLVATVWDSEESSKNDDGARAAARIFIGG